LEWFENTEQYMTMDPTQFAFNLLTRSFRVTHDNLRVRDTDFISGVDAWFARTAEQQTGTPVPSSPAPPPMFTPFKLRDLVLDNRVVVSPMCQYCASDGLPNDWHLVHIGARAQGGAALVISEMTDVSPDARISPGCAGIYTDEHTVAWKRIVDFVHANTRAKIGIQLGHAGRKGSTRVAWDGMDEPLEDGNWPIISPSPIPYFAHSQVPREMTRDDMDRVRDEFVAATHRATEAGFDLLELHLAHGYLLATFVSPLTNQRTDEYGGSLENRMRYPLEVFDAVRAVWPDDKPMSVRISAVDWAPGGTQPEDAVGVAAALAEHGCDIVDVSAGQTVAEARPVYGRQFQTPFADRIRHEVGIATMAVGNISSYTDVNTILTAGRADLCVLARAHLWDPYWTHHAAKELGFDLPWLPQYEVLDNYTPRFT
jgi:anthraniloyl-CoA monooxygenase